MRLEQLEYLIAVAETGSMSTASNLLHVTHQNISKALKQLEEELGAVLLVRNRQGIVLTDKGQEAFRYAKQMVALKHSLNQLAVTAQEESDTCETVPVLLAPAFYSNFSIVYNKFQENNMFAVRLFPEFKEPNYVTQKILCEDTSAQMIFSMMEYRAFLRHEEQLRKIFDVFVMCTEPILLITGNLRLVNQQTMVSMKTLEQVPLAVYRESLAHENFFLDCLKQNGFQCRNVMESGLSESCGQALNDGTAATIGTRFSMANSSLQNRSKTVAFIPIEPEVVVAHVMFVRKDAHPAVRGFAQLFREVYEGA